MSALNALFGVGERVRFLVLEVAGTEALFSRLRYGMLRTP